MKLTPQELMRDFNAGLKGEKNIDVGAILWGIIADLMDSVKLACEEHDKLPLTERQATIDSIYQTVEDYVVNNYVDD